MLLRVVVVRDPGGYRGHSAVSRQSQEGVQVKRDESKSVYCADVASNGTIRLTRI